MKNEIIQPTKSNEESFGIYDAVVRATSRAEILPEDVLTLICCLQYHYLTYTSGGREEHLANLGRALSTAQDAVDGALENVDLSVH